MLSEKPIIKDIRVLTEQFIPRRIIHRNGQLQEIRDNLKPLVDGEIPRHSFLNGPPGTGKTCMALYIVDELKAEVPISSAYINCWSQPSRFKILYSILQSFGHNFLHRKGTPTDELIDMLKLKMRNKRAVIILDEADQLEDDKVLYDLLEMEGICLVLIANTETIFYQSDPRIRSRLHSINRIRFRPYSTLEISDILKDRIEFGLVPDSITREQIEKIGEESGGDARAALAILKSAAMDAENSGAEKILDSHIDKAVPKSKSIDMDKIIEGLNTQQKILYGIVKSSGEISASDLYEKFKKISIEKGEEEIVDRTARKYVERLEFLGLISSKGDGRWTVYKVVG